MASPLQFVAVERAGHVATVTIQRPDKLNALNPAVLGELTAAFQELLAPAEGNEVRAAVLTGAGKAFVAGADIAEMAAMNSIAAKRFADAGHRLADLIETAPFPVIAAVNGFALGGGCELALACDFIYAAEGAKLGQPEVNLGVIPGFGGTQRLLRIDAPMQMEPQRATAPAVVGGVEIPAGAMAFTSFGAANHDPTVFPSPEQLDVTRPVAGPRGRHLGFGWGTHTCIGAPLARVAVRCAVQGVSRRLRWIGQRDMSLRGRDMSRDMSLRGRDMSRDMSLRRRDIDLATQQRSLRNRDPAVKEPFSAAPAPVAALGGRNDPGAALLRRRTPRCA